MSYSPTYSTLIFDVVDANVPKPATAELRIPVSPFSTTELALADYISSAEGIAGYFGGETIYFLSMGGISKIRLEIDLGIDPVSSAALADLRNVWEMTTNDSDPFRRSMPGRNPIAGLVVPGTKGQIANFSAATWTNFLVFLAGGADAIHMIDPETGSNTNFSTARATVRARQRPRV